MFLPEKDPTSLPKLRREKYTVALLVSPLELAATRAILDQEHQSIPCPNDQNEYVLGRIGMHNVVIVQTMSETPASVTHITTSLFRSFPGVGHGIIMGIAGGPGLVHNASGETADTRLGDVVVSKLNPFDLQDLKPRQIPDKVEDISALYAQNRCLLCPKRPIEDQPSSPKTAHGSDDDAYESPKISTISKQYFVKGVVSGHSIEALPDSGANVSIISNTLASELGLDPKPGTEKTIYLANKKAIRSPGMVTVPWKFDGESRMYPLDCWILPKSIHTIVLGKPFLNVTQTLKALASRIKCKIVNGPRRLRLHLLGGESENEKVWGYLNDRFTTAFPDTGSDVMLISRKYAEELELDMDTRVEDRVEVEFPDGSTAWTSGIIRDASWRIGSKTTNCDFYVLDELCVDVVLSNEYLFNENVFSECDIYFFDAELDVAGDFSSSFCNIRLIGRYGGYLNSLEEEYLEDSTSPDAFTDEKVQRELARRDRIRDEINELPEDQRDTARLDEVERQRQWEQKRQIHRNTYHPQSTSQQTPSTPHRTEVVQGRIHPETAGKFHLSTWKKRVKKKIGS